jgi:hypothetical protein
MNVFAEAEKPVLWRVALFGLTTAATFALTIATVAQSKRLADMLDVLSDARLGWKAKWRQMGRMWKAAP